MSDSDDSDDLANLPSAAECEERSQQFAAVTGTDTALAMFYLQDRGWELERALNAYFEEHGGSVAASLAQQGSASKETTATNTGAVKASGSAGGLDNGALSVGKAQADVDPEPHRIRLLSWNIDGLDLTSIKTRTQGVCQTILKENPDIVYLQEVVPQTLKQIEELCPTYQVVPAGKDNYFTAMLLKVTSVVYEEHKIHTFYSSLMDRNLLTTQAQVKGVNVTLMTSHLESTASHADERKKQLRTALKEMTGTPSDRTVIFGGDLNSRDKELQEIGGLPSGILDLWEVNGKRPEAKFTWDLTRNDNLDWGQKFKPKCRFDRVYLKHSRAPKLKPVYFELVGLERLDNCRRFPSDHWGVLCHFDKI